MATSTSVTLLSANIFDKHGKPVFTPSRIVSLTLKDGKTAKVALIGVTRPLDATRREFTPANDATVTTPAKTLKKLIPELRKKADLVVLLAYYTREDVPQLVKELPPDARPDVVICGEFTAGQRQSYYLENADTPDGVWSLSGGFEGRQVGVALIELGKKGKVQNVYPKLVIIEQTIPPDEAFTPFVKEFQAGQLELLRKGI
jgi:2',3'-cyclic-nucleotide 2'-phosphodiesterase (5'-nucleotidase family)